MSNVRSCRDDERTAILAVINAAAEAYRGVIPVDRWHEPYMPRDELDREIAAGVTFWGVENDGALARISHTIECIGAANQRKLLCGNNLARLAERPDADRV